MRQIRGNEKRVGGCRELSEREKYYGILYKCVSFWYLDEKGLVMFHRKITVLPNFYHN